MKIYRKDGTFIMEVKDLSTDLKWADLRNADLRNANLQSADLSWANLTEADLEGANLYQANLSGADLQRANLTGTALYKANLSGANLSNVALSNPNEVLKEHFEFNKEGMVVYKMFGNTSFPLNSAWKIEENSMISETCNWNRQDPCGCGVNFGTKQWVMTNYPGQELWECLIPWGQLAGVVVPLNFEGKARCSNLVLIKKID